MIGIHSQTPAPPAVWNGWPNRVNTVTVIAIAANPSENEEYRPMLRRSICRYPRRWSRLTSSTPWS